MLLPLKRQVGFEGWQWSELGTLPTDTAGKLDVLGHDGDTLGVDGAQVGVLEETDQVGLGCFLQFDKKANMILRGN